MTSIDRIQYVLDFWFGKPSDPDYLKSKSLWYGNDETDQWVREILANDYEKAKSGEYDHWSDTVNGGIALIILFDQVPRNIFRDTPQAYETDNKALEIARKLVDNSWDKNQHSILRRYIYSPFHHSENLNDQKRSVELFTELGDPQHLYWAQNFYNTIQTYGRFPHRDKILLRDRDGRCSN